MPNPGTNSPSIFRNDDKERVGACGKPTLWDKSNLLTRPAIRYWFYKNNQPLAPDMSLDLRGGLSLCSICLFDVRL